MTEDSKPARPWDVVNPNIPHVDEQLKAQRMAICGGCEHLIKFTKQCKKCGCFMHLKTLLPHASCPVGKWEAVQ